MKTLTYLLLIQVAYAVDVVDPKYQVMEHPNPGCPINSECSKTSGKLMQAWTTLTEKTNAKNTTKALKNFKQKNGLPIQILARKDIYQKADPILWNSRCEIHNPKNPNKTIYRGYLFLKKLKHDQAVFTTVDLYEGKKKTRYNIPYGDQISVIKNNQLIVLKDYEDFYYKLAISPNGDFQPVSLPNSLVQKALNRKIKEIECPDEQEIDEDFFKKSYCQKVLDLDTNRLRLIQFSWSCP